MAARRYQVRYNDGDDEWKVRLTNSSRASKTANTKKKAVRKGKKLAKQRGVSLEVFTRDGRHQETVTYGTTSRAKQR